MFHPLGCQHHKGGLAGKLPGRLCHEVGQPPVDLKHPCDHAREPKPALRSAMSMMLDGDKSSKSFKMSSGATPL